MHHLRKSNQWCSNSYKASPNTSVLIIEHSEQLFQLQLKQATSTHWEIKSLSILNISTFKKNRIYLKYNSCQHRSADYWDGGTLEDENLSSSFHRPNGR